MAENSAKRVDVFRERKRWLFLGLPWTFTVYHVREDMITIDRGFLNKQEDDCYMYKVTDVRLNATFLERLVGLGTVTCFTGDATDATLEFKHIRNARAVKDYILEVSDKERIKRRTVNMQGIGYAAAGHPDIDGDGLPDDL
ncbi:MAG: PH domain-containing protein [Lachnospiraceae bacterium]|nr:PH domain-containing protein [Lachnospiraceae bacterium]